MLDQEFIRNNANEVRLMLFDRGADTSLVTSFLNVDTEYTRALRERDILATEKNRLSKLRITEEDNELFHYSRELKKVLAQANEQVGVIKKTRWLILMSIPNMLRR